MRRLLVALALALAAAPARADDPPQASSPTWKDLGDVTWIGEGISIGTSSVAFLIAATPQDVAESLDALELYRSKVRTEGDEDEETQRRLQLGSELDQAIGGLPIFDYDLDAFLTYLSKAKVPWPSNEYKEKARYLNESRIALRGGSFAVVWRWRDDSQKK